MITVNGRILQKKDTTANWNYVNPVLPAKQLGWEYDNDGVTPIGVKIGDGTTTWDLLPYQFATFPPIKIIATTPIPKNIVMNAAYFITGKKQTFITEIPTPGDVTGTKLTEFKDMQIDKTYFDNTFNQLISVDVYGHDDGAGLFAEDTYLTIKV